MKTTRKLFLFASAALVALGAANTPVSAADKMSIAVPGVPPVISTVMIYVAEEGGFYKKHGLDVNIQPFRSGVAAAKVVLSVRPKGY